jgi:membrane-bound serine protease (ClpP class)
MDHLLTETAVAVADFEQAGLVRVHGELWQAVTQVPVASGDLLRIVRVDGLTLQVTPALSRPAADTA